MDRQKFIAELTDSNPRFAELRAKAVASVALLDDTTRPDSVLDYRGYAIDIDSEDPEIFSSPTEVDEYRAMLQDALAPSKE